jgi:hypothetical protein
VDTGDRFFKKLGIYFFYVRGEISCCVSRHWWGNSPKEAQIDNRFSCCKGMKDQKFTGRKDFSGSKGKFARYLLRNTPIFLGHVPLHFLAMLHT